MELNVTAITFINILNEEKKKNNEHQNRRIDR
jgi:hypothetical protein